MTIGHVEVSYSDKEFAETLRSSLWVDITQVAIVSLLFVGSLYIVSTAGTGLARCSPCRWPSMHWTLSTRRSLWSIKTVMSSI